MTRTVVRLRPRENELEVTYNKAAILARMMGLTDIGVHRFALSEVYRAGQDFGYEHAIRTRIHHRVWTWLSKFVKKLDL